MSETAGQRWARRLRADDQVRPQLSHGPQRVTDEPDPEHVPLPFLGFDATQVPSSSEVDPFAQAAAHLQRNGLTPEEYRLGEPQYRMPLLWEGDQA